MYRFQPRAETHRSLQTRLLSVTSRSKGRELRGLAACRYSKSLLEWGLRKYCLLAWLGHPKWFDVRVLDNLNLPTPYVCDVLNLSANRVGTFHAPPYDCVFQYSRSRHEAATRTQISHCRHRIQRLPPYRPSLLVGYPPPHPNLAHQNTECLLTR